MKKAFCFTYMYCLFIGLQAQTEIFAGYNSTHSGRSITLVASKTINSSHEFGGGLRFNINSLKQPDDQMNIYLKRLYATKTIQHFGLQGFYHAYFFKKWEHVKPFAFYDLQITYSTTRNRDYPTIVNDTNGNVYTNENINYFGPFTWVEQNIGIGFKVDLFHNFFFHEKIGVGIDYILGYDDQLTGKLKPNGWFEWEFGPLFNVGIGYRFEKKNKK